MPPKTNYRGVRKALADRLRMARKRRKMTQQEVADRLGISKTRITLKERGKEAADLEYLEAVASIWSTEPWLVLAPEDLQEFLEIWHKSSKTDRERLLRVAKSLREE